MFPVIRTNKNKDALPEKIGEIDIKISSRFERQKQNVNKTKSIRAVSENRGKCIFNYIFFDKNTNKIEKMQDLTKLFRKMLIHLS